MSGFYDIDPDVLPADVAIGEEVVPVGGLPGETRARTAAMLAYFSDLNEEDPLAFEGVVRHVASHGMDLGAMPEVIAIGNDRVPIGSMPRERAIGWPRFSNTSPIYVSAIASRSRPSCGTSLYASSLRARRRDEVKVTFPAR